VHQTEGTHGDDLKTATEKNSNKFFRRIASADRIRCGFVYEFVPMTRKSTPIAETKRQ
jgi:hypothetical protein